jgi:hypothetical protein
VKSSQRLLGITKDLLDIVNVQTGKPIVGRVIRTAEMYHGDYLNLLPTFWWNGQMRRRSMLLAPKNRRGSRRISLLPIRRPHPHGLFIVKALPSRRALERTVSILILPQLSRHAGVHLPDMMAPQSPKLSNPRISSRGPFMNDLWIGKEDRMTLCNRTDRSKCIVDWPPGG